MPFQPFSFHPVPTTRQDVRNEYARADGACDVHERHSKRTGSSPEADLHEQVVQRAYELACGCLSPPAEVAGVCATCVAEQRPPEVCEAHFIVCSCGSARCWNHSHPIDSDESRECEQCHLRRGNEAFQAKAVSALKRAADCILFE